MNNLVELYIENSLVDLDENISIPITKQIDDILSPGSIKNSFSKTISIPNTNNNNILFGNIWNCNKIVLPNPSINKDLNFNPSKKANFKLLYNGNLFQSGYVKLSDISFTNEKLWKYNINLFGELGNFIDSLGEDLLSESLGFSGSAYNQTFVLNQTSMFNLYSKTIAGGLKRFDTTNLNTFYSSSDTIASDLDNATYYNDKFIDFIDSENGVYNIANKIQYQTGSNDDEVKQQSNLSSDYTETYIKNKLDYKTRFGVYTDQILNNILDNNSKYNISFGDFKNLNNPYWFNLLTTSPLLSKDSSLGNFSFTYSGDLELGDTDEKIIDSPFDDFEINYDNTGSNFQLSGYTTLTKDPSLNNLYSIEYSYTFIELTITGLPSTIVDVLTIAPLTSETLVIDFNIPYSTEDSVKATLTLVNTTSANPYRAWWRGLQTAGNEYATIELYDYATSSWISFKNYLIKYYSKLQVYLALTNKLTYSITKFKDSPSIMRAGHVLNLDWDEYGLTLVYNVESLWTPQKIGSGATVSLLNLLPKVKTKDFLLSYIKIFGLYLDINEVTKEVIIKTRNEFYEDYQILDWGDKLCRDQEINIVPLNFNNKKIRLGYKKSTESQLAKIYNTNNLEYYGDTVLDTGYDFNNQEFNMFPDLIFEPIISKDLTSTIMGIEDNKRYKIIPVIAKESSNKLSPYDPIGLTFMNGYINKPNYYIDSDYQSQNFIFTSDSSQMIDNNEVIHNREDYVPQYVFSQFKFVQVSSNNVTPFASSTVLYKESGNSYPNMKTITHSLDFSKPKEIYYSVDNADYPESATLYNRFWKTYLEDRYNINTKILTGYFYLSPSDVVNFKFNNFILLDGSIWSVNKIIDYDLTSNNPTKVELIKVNDINNYINGQNI